MSHSRIRVALIGCGGIAALYRKVYAKSPLSKPVAFIDRDLEAAKEAARDCGVDESAASTDLERALDDQVDAVVVNTPNHLHLEHGVAVIRAGKHLLMQKPLAGTLHDAQQLVDAAAGSDRVNAMYLSFLDQRLYHELRAQILAGEFGRIAHVNARYMHRGGIAWSRAAERGEKTWRSSLVQTGGGCFIQLGVHYAHLISWLTGEEPVRIRGYARNVGSPGIEGEDVASALIRYPSGMVATLDTAWIAQSDELSISGSERSISYVDQRWLLTEDPPTCSQVLPPPMDDLENPYNGHRAFLEAIAGIAPVPVPLERGLEEMRVVDAFYRSARLGDDVDIASHVAAGNR
jgi:predicted dehydrogenase